MLTNLVIKNKIARVIYKIIKLKKQFWGEMTLGPHEAGSWACNGEIHIGLCEDYGHVTEA